MKLSDVSTSIQLANNDHIPLFLWGPPGIGKTAIVKAAADLLGVELVTLRTNLLEPVDFLGLPTPDGDRVKWLIPDFFPSFGTKGILFLDEFPQAPMATQCAAMRMVDNIPDGWQVIAAGNRATDRAGAGQVATHVLSRFTHLEVDVTREDWKAWALDTGLRSEILSFIDFRPGLLMPEYDPKQVQEHRASCSPRAWHRASNILAVATDELQLELLKGTVGEGTAAEFIAFLRVFEQCPSADEILSKAETFKVPADPSALYAICGSLADKARTLKKKDCDPLFTFMSRLPVEFAALLATDILRVNVELTAHKTYGKWVTEHNHIWTGK